MKRSIHVPAVIAICLLMVSAVFANDDETVRILKFPAFTEPELKQVPFSAIMPKNYNPNGVHISLHNPFRDRTIAGVVVEVAFKRASEEKPTVLNLFIRIDCGPLQSGSAAEACFEANEAREAAATITLKEVHYFLPDSAKSE